MLRGLSSNTLFWQSNRAGMAKSADQLLPRAENLRSDKNWKSAHSFITGMLEMLHFLLLYSCVLCANPHECIPMYTCTYYVLCANPHECILIMYTCTYYELCANPHERVLSMVSAFHTSESMNVYLHSCLSPRAQSRLNLDPWVYVLWQRRVPIYVFTRSLTSQRNWPFQSHHARKPLSPLLCYLWTPPLAKASGPKHSQHQVFLTQIWFSQGCFTFRNYTSIFSYHQSDKFFSQIKRKKD